MDKCQPITATLKSGARVFILLIEDEKLKNAKDPECYCYASSHFSIAGGAFFKSLDEALDHAMKCAAQLSPIVKIEPTLGFDNFFDDTYLKKYY